MPYAEVNDTRLHIRQAGTGPVALFIHGFPLDSTMWIEQIADLAAVRRCIAPDLRGFGRSAPVTGAPLTMEQHADDLAACDRLAARHVHLRQMGIDRVNPIPVIDDDHVAANVHDSRIGRPPRCHRLQDAQRRGHPEPRSRC